ncbi:Visual pigment-like receptor peropsin [Holothuria leucospilota]|uniref:Visual pigment-like receptor peropsin n=1 Tax=Holothuria leucospilota TaxID=206669 RepID=A0A9Q0YNS8_HOLLE|nr:Visual pigment-like receptor peropsin [Holothuria leucospilota]
MVRMMNGTSNEESRPEHTIIGVFLIVCALVALVGNGIIVAMFAKYRQLRNPSNLLIATLALVDIGMAALCFPVSAWASIVGAWTFGDRGCRYYGFISMFCGISVIGILTLMAIDRYVVISRRSVAANLTMKHYGGALMLAFSNAAFWAIMPNLGWSSYAIEPSLTSCAIDYQTNDMHYITYLVALFIVCFVVPLCVMVFCYWRTHSVMSKREEIQNAITEESAAPINAEWCNQKEVTQMGAVLVFLFLLAWSTEAVVCLWAAFGEPSNIPYPLTLLGPLAAKSSIVLNPLVITMMIGKFRSHMAMMFKMQPDVTPLHVNAQQLRSDSEKEL